VARRLPENLTRVSGTVPAVLDVEEVDPFEAFNKATGADGDATPYPGLAELRATAGLHVGVPDMGVFENESGMPAAFSAYSYEAVETIFKDPETFSSAGYGEIMGQVLGRTILEMDPPEHRAYRSILQQAFTRQEMARWQVELVGPMVDRLIDGFVDDGKVDLVRELLFPFPLNVIAALLGLPDSDLPAFHRLAVEIISVLIDIDISIRASAELNDLLLPIVTARRAEPLDDMISVLAHAEADGQRLTDEEIISFCRLLLPAGAETTYRSSSNLLLGLLTHTDQLDALVADRSLFPQAIEEGIRWEPPLLLVSRGVTRDTEVCGVQVPAGSSIITSIGSANHDESRWNDPESFDIFRDRRPHIGFAAGPHMCLGMHLARMETQTALGRVFDRLPGLRLDPDAPAPYISGSIFRAPPRLDVVWG
jgi:cytochrome P450